MTREEAYAEGFHEGRRWAEADVRDGLRLDPDGGIGPIRAWEIGAKRGYRDTWARYDAGTLTPEMFELAPRGKTLFTAQDPERKKVRYDGADRYCPTCGTARGYSHVSGAECAR